MQIALYKEYCKQICRNSSGCAISVHPTSIWQQLFLEMKFAGFKFILKWRRMHIERPKFFRFRFNLFTIFDLKCTSIITMVSNFLCLGGICKSYGQSRNSLFKYFVHNENVHIHAWCCLLCYLHAIQTLTSLYVLYFRDDFMSFFDTSVQPRIMKPQQQNKKKVKPAWASIT